MTSKQIRKLEKELWEAADLLRANSKLTASQYSMPVLGLIFLRHAFNRFEKAREEIEKSLPVHPQRGKRSVNKSDYLEKNAIFLPEKARYDYLVSLPQSKDIGDCLNEAMKVIEEEHTNLTGILPKNYTIFSNDLLVELLRIFNHELLKRSEGDIFGRIYEYFLNKFAMTGAQEGGEFFTPFSLVSTIVNIIEPDHGTILDPACGSAGMFVQTGYFIQQEGKKIAESVTFFGQEKTETNTHLAKMNMAVHGLEGTIKEGNTFYVDKHTLAGMCDFVMANPPFNVNGVDKGKDVVKKDKRLMIDGKVLLPKNDNANYMWILYFYNYLNDTGRAGFVMASSASDAGHSEKEIREKLVRTGAVDVMVAIGNNFFYTRSLPCTLWFFDRTKELLTLNPSPNGEGLKSEGKEHRYKTVETGLTPILVKFARELRQNKTTEENMMWQLLRNRQLNGMKFRRQHPLETGFIIDFYCAEFRLGIELDGGHHSKAEQKKKDEERTKVINKYGIKIIRFKNEEVVNDTENVLLKILETARINEVNESKNIFRTKETVLMLDARKIYRKVTQKINDFSPEQLQNITCVVDLYRGNTDKFNKAVKEYLKKSFENAKESAEKISELQKQFKRLHKLVKDFSEKYSRENAEAKKFTEALKIEDIDAVYEGQNKLIADVKGLKEDYKKLEDISHQCRNIKKLQDRIIKNLTDAINNAVKEYQLNKNKDWKDLDIKEEINRLKELQKQLSGDAEEEEPGLLHEAEYFWKQAHWLKSRFPEGKYKDVEGLCKAVNQKEIEEKDWSLSPGRYVGVDAAPPDDFDYEERLKEIHIELKELNEEANELARVIDENYKEMEV